MINVIITIDAEGVHGSKPFEQMFLGQIGEKEQWGIEMMAKHFYNHGIQATFFTDVYEYCYYGEKKLRNAIDLIMKNNQDVQLHTHPSWSQDYRDSKVVKNLKATRSCFDADRYWMNRNNYYQQIEILEKGINLIKRWSGKKPVAHRAGAYAINKDTIRALKKVGLSIDSSMHYGHPNCKVNWSKNKIVEKHGIIEVPVTIFKRRVKAVFGEFNIPLRKWIIKTDIDVANLEELIKFIRFARINNLSLMTLFIHSYSLIKFDRYFKNFEPDYIERKKLVDFLEFCLNESDVRFVSMSKFLEEYKLDPKNFNGLDIVPVIDYNVNGSSYFRKKLNVRNIFESL